MNLGQSISASFADIFPTWPTLVATILAFCILLIVLTFLVYKPVKKMYKARQKFIQDNIDSSKAQKSEAKTYLTQAQDNLQKSYNEANKILEDAKYEADKIRELELSKTKNLTQQMVDEAKNEVAKQKLNLEKETKKYIVDLALDAARKVVEKEVDSKTNKKLIEDFIKDQK